jgi:kynurenine formamidase
MTQDVFHGRPAVSTSLQERESLMSRRCFAMCAGPILPLCFLVLVATAEAPADARPAVTTADVEKMMTSLSNWGRWGKSDELGTLNLITPKKRIQAARLVRAGVSVSMAHDVVKVKMDDSEPFEHEVILGAKIGDVGGVGDRYSVKYHGFTHTHIDALCHIFYKGKMYNGFSSDLVKRTGVGKLSINRVKNGIFTRAVLMDMPALFGVRFLSGKQAIYPKHLEAWEKQAGITVQPGDALLIHTGRWTRRQVQGSWKIMQDSAGLHASCLPWLKKRDVAIIGSDLALDVMPSGIDKFELPVHCVVIVSMGMCILDVLDFRAIAVECRKRKRWEFLLTVSPLAVEGGTGSPINPIGTF